MGYCTQADVEFYGQFSSKEFSGAGYEYDESIAKAITIADRMIDDYCNVPETFFIAEGLTITNEYLNGVDIAYLGGVTQFFGWYYGGTSHLKFKYKPVLSVTKLEEETSTGSWIPRTLGTHYIVVEDGVRFITNTPSWKYKNIRVTYKAGYTTTPSAVAEASGRLAAAMLRRIKDAANPQTVAVQGLSVGVSPDASLTKPVFSDELKNLLQNYRRIVYAFS